MRKWEHILFLSLSGAVFIYLALRSFYVPLIHDEAASYYIYMQSGNFIPPWAYLDAANQLFNSFFGWVFSSLFGPKEWSIRLGSLIGFVGLIYFLRLHLIAASSVLQRWVLIIPLLFAPFFIEFFALARGYGLAMAGFMASFYFVKQHAKSTSKKHLVGILVATWLTSFANFSVTPAVLILVSLHGFSMWLNSKYNKRYLFEALVIILAQAPFIWHILELKNNAKLYYGGPDFIEFTAMPFAKYFLKNEGLWWLVIAVFTLGIATHLISTIKTGWQSFLLPKAYFGNVLILASLSMFAQQIVLGVNYPEDRAALFFFPLLVGTCSNLDWKPAQAIVLMLFIWFPIDLVSSGNLKYSRLWKHEYIDEKMWQASIQNQNDYPPSLSSSLTRQSIWSFYSLTENSNSYSNYNDYPSTWSDLLLLGPEKRHEIDLKNYQVLYYDSLTHQQLLKRSPELIETELSDTTINTVQKLGMYFNVLKASISSNEEKGLAIYCDLKLAPVNIPPELYLIVEVKDTRGEKIHFAQHSFASLQSNWIKNPSEKLKMHVPPIDGADSILVYLYNPKKKEYVLKSIDLAINHLNQPN